MTKLYLLIIDYGAAPWTEGPYDTDELRLEAAAKFWKVKKNQHEGISRLNIESDGTPSIVYIEHSELKFK